MRKKVNILVALLITMTVGIVTGGTTQVFAADSKPTVYLCGDSTVQTYSASYAPQAGWGQMISKYFTTDVLFVNRSIGGRSSKSFIVDGRLDDIINVIKPGDYLFVQFGHNDATISKPERYTEPTTEYKQYLRQYIDKARSKNAIPVLITPVARLNYSNGVYKNDFPAYCTSMKEVAVEKNVACIDLMTNSINYYNTLTYNQVYKLYLVSSNGTDYTHFTESGATEIARIVAEGVKALNLQISQFVINVSSTKPVVITPKPTPTTSGQTSTPTPKPTTGTPTITPTNTPYSVPEDINGDGAVNMTDVMLIAAYFNTITTNNSRKCDLNNDGAVNMTDVMIVAKKFNTVVTPPNVIYQAEYATIYQGVQESINAGYTGSGYVNYNNETGSYVEWDVTVPSAGTYTLNLMYSNGTTVNRPMEFKINGISVFASIDFNPTGTWTTWTSTTFKVNLNKGKNTVRATAVTANGGPNVDYIEICK